jgi:hypothetical protein
MAKCDSSPIDVDLFDVQPKLSYTVNVHRSESFIYLLLGLLICILARFLEVSYLE